MTHAVRQHLITDFSLVGLSAALLVCVALQPLASLGLACFLGLLFAAILRPGWMLNVLVGTLPLQAVLVFTYRANIKPSELLGCLLILAVAIRCLAWKETVVRIPLIVGPLLLFLALVLLSTLNTARFRGAMVLNQYMDVGIGRDSPDTRSYLTAAWGVYCTLLLFSIPTILRTVEQVYRAFRVLFWSGAAAAAFGIFQWIYLLRTERLFELPGSTYHLDVVHSTLQGFPRSPGTFTEPAVFANYLILILPITLALATGSYPEIVKRKHAYFALALEVIALVLSFSVSGYVLFLIALCLFGYLASYLRSRTSGAWILARRALAGVMAILVIVAVLQFVGIYPADVGEFIAARLLGEADSAQQRFGLARIAWEMTKDHALTGVGIGNFPFLAMSYAAAHSIALTMFIFPTPSNLFALLPAELGVPGMLAFLWLAFRIGKCLKRGLARSADEFRLLHVGLCTAIGSALLSFMFLDNLFVIYLWVLLGLAIALQLAANRIDINRAELQ